MRANPRQITVAAAVVVVLAVLVGIMLYDSPPAQQPTGGPATTAPASEQPTSTPAEPAPTSARPLELRDGIYTVGSEVPAGTYVTTAGTKPCYWARLRSFGKADSIIEDENLEPGQSARVVVKATDRGFKVSNGCTWHQAL